MRSWQLLTMMAMIPSAKTRFQSEGTSDFKNEKQLTPIAIYLNKKYGGEYFKYQNQGIRISRKKINKEYLCQK